MSIWDVSSGQRGATRSMSRGQQFTFISLSAPYPAPWTLTLNLDVTADTSDPDPAILAILSWGVEGGRHIVRGDWQPGARITLIGSSVELVAKYDTTRSPTGAPLDILVSASIAPGVFAQPSFWGFTTETTIAAGATELVAVPAGATSVTAYAPTPAAWGSIDVGERTGRTAANRFTRTPTVPETYPILLGCRWVSLKNNSGGPLTCPVIFGLTT